MISKNQCLVLIPAYNEEANIARVLSVVRNQGYPILVVDDGSKDDTVGKAKTFGAGVLTAESNQGKGAALRRGFDWFLKSSYQALILMDADGQHDAQELDLFLDALNEKGNDFIVGNRMANAKDMPLVRAVTNRTMSLIISAMATQIIPDSQCGYRAIKKETLAALELNTSHYEIETEMLLESARKNFKIRSVPIRCVYEGAKSQIHPLRDTLRFFIFLLKYSLSRKSP